MEKQSKITPENNSSKPASSAKPKRQARENAAYSPLPPLAEPNIQEISRQLNKEVKTNWVSIRDSALVGFVTKHWFVLSFCAVLTVFITSRVQLKLNDSSPIIESRVLPSLGFGLNNTGQPAPSFTEKEVLEYVRRFEKVALKEQEKFGVPACLTLACGILKSNAGKAKWAADGNNHFAIPCSKNLLSEGLLGEKELEGKCYTNYENAWTSFRAHTMLLTQGKIGKATNGLAPSDVAAWANAMATNGYGEEALMALALIKEHGL